MEVFNKLKSLLFAEIINPLIILLFAAALLYFIWGVLRFIYYPENTKERADGKRHMIWGIVGIAIMLSVFGIMNFIFNTVTNNGTVTGPKGIKIEKPSPIRNF